MRENRPYGSEGGGIELNRSSLPLSGEMSLRDKHSFATLVSEHWLRVAKRCVVQRAGPGGIRASAGLKPAGARRATLIEPDAAGPVLSLEVAPGTFPEPCHREQVTCPRSVDQASGTATLRRTA